MNPIGNQAIAEGQTLSFTVIATNPNPAQELTYTASNLPTGATFDPETQTFTWTPSYTQAAVYPNVLFTVTNNGTPPMQAQQAITITVGYVNMPPVLTQIPNQTVNENQLLQFVVTATDPNGNPVTLSAGGLPTGASFNPTTGMFNWVTAYGQAGNYLVTFTATGGNPPLQVSQQVTITVGYVNCLPIIKPIGNQAVDALNTLTFTVTATDPHGQQLTYSASNLPPGASFNSATQVFSWTPTYGQIQNWPNVEFIVANNGTPMEEACTDITITVGFINRPPVFTLVGTQKVLEGQLVQFTVSATDPDGDRVTYSTGNLPAGATFNPATEVFTWTPNYAQAGLYLVKFYAADSKDISMSTELDVVIAVSVPTPCELEADIIEYLATLGLPKVIENAYLAELNLVCGHVENGKCQLAALDVLALVELVMVDADLGHIQPSAATTLEQMSNDLIRQLSQ